MLLVSPRVLAGYLNLPTRNYVVLLSIGTTFYVPLGVRCGLTQGRLTTFIWESTTCGSCRKVVARGHLWGMVVFIAAIVASIIVLYFLASPPRELRWMQNQAWLNLAIGEGIRGIGIFHWPGHHQQLRYSIVP